VISSLARPKTLRIAGLAIGAVAVAGSAVAITASAAGYSFNLGGPSSHSPSGGTTGLVAAPQDAAGASAVCTDFINHFAADLGTDQTRMNAAFQQAVAETLADQVKAGKLTQAQADAIKARLAGKKPCAIGPSLSAPVKASINAYTQQLLAAAASALDITPAQLMADFGKGMSLSQIAAAHNPPITEAQFRTSLIANLTPMLDKAVSDGKLTTAQEQQIINRLKTGAIPFWSKAPKHPAATPPTTATQ
jgi:hypothetical protein